MPRLSSEEVLVLKAIYEHKSLQEIGQEIGKSTSMANKIVQSLIEEKLILPPPKPHMSRSHSLTVLAKDYLRANGHMPN
jgi:DNA-binding MarR family transcriptional regulator